MTESLIAPELYPERPAFDIDAWLCAWCNNPRDPERGTTCPCIPATTRVVAEVAGRHRSAVVRARHRQKLQAAA